MSERISSRKSSTVHREEIHPESSLASLSEKESEILKEFRQRVLAQKLSESEQKWCSDYCLVRFLKARDWNADKSFDMIMNCLKWRKEYKPETITAQDVLIELKNEGKMYLNGKDKLGRPIVYMKPGLDNTLSGDRDLKLKYLIYILEKAIAKMDEPKGIEKLIWIIDFKGHSGLTGVSNLKMSKETSEVLTNYYPERLGVAFVVNPPWVFHVFWKFVSPFLTETTKRKLRLVSDFSEIREVVDEEVLEADYGGKNTFRYNFDLHWNKEDVPGDQNNTNPIDT